MAKRIRRVGIYLDDAQVYLRPLMGGLFAYARAHGPWQMTFLRLNASRIGGRREQPGNELDGMVIDAAVNPTAARRAAAVGLPAVDVNPSPRPSRPLPQVLPDHAEVGRMVGRHFLERGFQQFGCFVLPRAMDQIWCERRLGGFLESIGDRRCSVYRSAASTWDRLYGRAERARISRWLVSLPKATAVLACMDSLGWHLLATCRDLGIMVPEQISLVGVNDELVVCETADPPMSSVDLGPAAVGYAAAALLDRLMSAAQDGAPAAPPDEMLVQPAGLIARRSSDILAVVNVDVARALRFIAERAPVGPLNVSMILQEVMVSRRWLERQFRHILGRTIRQQIWHARIERAKKLLVETDLPMPAVAQQAGFGSAVQLSIVFKRTLGEPPTAHRTRHRSRLLLASR